jgi:hypothetical protein
MYETKKHAILQVVLGIMEKKLFLFLMKKFNKGQKMGEIGQIDWHFDQFIGGFSLIFHIGCALGQITAWVSVALGQFFFLYKNCKEMHIYEHNIPMRKIEQNVPKF